MPTTALEGGGAPQPRAPSISQFIFTHKSGLPVPRPTAQSLHSTRHRLHRREKRATSEDARGTPTGRSVAHAPTTFLAHACFSVVSRVSFTCASHRRELRYTGNRAHMQRLVTIRAAGASSERERETTPLRGALQARHVVSIQSSAIPSRVTAHHQGACVKHMPRSDHRAPRHGLMDTMDLFPLHSVHRSIAQSSVQRAPRTVVM